MAGGESDREARAVFGSIRVGMAIVCVIALVHRLSWGLNLLDDDVRRRFALIMWQAGLRGIRVSDRRRARAP